jgi:hypothetical protein
MSNQPAANDPAFFEQFAAFQRFQQAQASALPSIDAGVEPKDSPARPRSQPKRSEFEALFDVATLRHLRTPFLVLLNFIGIATSVVTTLTTVLLAERVLTNRISWVGVGVGLGLALLLGIGQWVCLAGFRERWYGARWRWLIGYVIFLIPDVVMSFVQSWLWVVQPLLTAATRGLSLSTQLALMWFIGSLVALFSLTSSVAPERFLFGRNRRRKAA